MFTAQEHAALVDQANGAVAQESARAQRSAAAWSATAQASQSRRTFLTHGLHGGILIAGWPVIGSRAAIRSIWPGTRMGPARDASTKTLVLATNRAPSDLDPHSAYDPGSQIALQGLFEGLIQLQPGTTDTIIPVLAESWAANPDMS